MPPRVTLIDVAAAAGVSRATASRVLAGTDRNVNSALAQRVFDASERLGYRTNAVARALRTRSTRTIGILVPSIRNPYFIHLVDAFTRVADRAGRRVILADSGDDIATECDRIDALLESLVDGLVVVPTSMTGSGLAIRKAAGRSAVVQVDRWTQDAQCGFVGVDNDAGVATLVEHLRSSGRASIAYVGAEHEASSGAERLAAFRRLARPGDSEILLPHFSMDAGHEAAKRLRARPMPDAVLCAADVLAVGLVTTLQREGVAVPDTVAVTGFDGTDLLELVNPPITALRHPLESIAVRALELLSAPRQPEQRVCLVPELVVRSST